MMLDCRAKNKVKSSGYSGDILRKISKQSDLQIKVLGPKFKNQTDKMLGTTESKI